MNKDSKIFLKINDKRYELTGNLYLISDFNDGKVIGDILIEKLNIDTIYKFNYLMKNNKIEIHKTTSEKLTINNGLKSETNIKFTNEICNKDNNTSFHTIFKAVEKYLTKFFLERDKELEKKKLEEAEIQEAKKLKLEQEKIEREKKNKEAEEKELNRLVTMGKICEKFFDFVEMNENFENQYNGKAIFKIKPFIEGKSIMRHRIIGKREPFMEQKSDRINLQMTITNNDRSAILEFRW